VADEQLLIAERIQKEIEQSESQFREFKSACERDAAGNMKRRPAKEIAVHIAQELVAFANADGGLLLVGVEDDGVVTGVPHSDDKVQVMLNSPKTHVHSDAPLPSPVVRKVEIDGKTVLYFTCQKV